MIKKIKRLKERWDDPYDPICYDIIEWLLIFKIVVIVLATIFFIFMHLKFGSPLPSNFPPRGF